MKKTRTIMAMEATVEVVGERATQAVLDRVFDYFSYVDQIFSTHKKNSEISQINRGELEEEVYSDDMRSVLALCEETRDETNGYFNIQHKGKLDPSGLVKGWAIHNAALLLEEDGFADFCIEIDGDIEVRGVNAKGKPWRIGVRNPFKPEAIAKVVELHDKGIATSRSYIKGHEVYNPLKPTEKMKDIVSVTVIGPDAYEADRFATAAFAMGYKGIEFIQKMNGYEGYLIDVHGIAIFTKGFTTYVIRDGNVAK